MSRAYQCDHCQQYFDGGGSHWIKREVCDKKHGFVRYKTTMFIHGSSGPPADFVRPNETRLAYERSGSDLCADCIQKIILASLNKEKL